MPAMDNRTFEPRMLMLCPSDPRQNHLLAALPAEDLERLLPFLERVPLAVGQVLCQAGEPMRHIYFPTDAIVSLLYTIKDGSALEIAVVGNEGLVGLVLFMGGETTLNRAMVQCPGSAYRLKGSLLKTEFDQAGALQQQILRYTQALLTQMAQRLVCVRLHSLDQQLCNWLLQYFERLPNNRLLMTQELIAHLLGVRRGSVSEVAGKLQDAGLISYHRGCISLLDQPGLQQRSCECYGVVRSEFARLFPRAAHPLLAASLPALLLR